VCVEVMAGLAKSDQRLTAMRAETDAVTRVKGVISLLDRKAKLATRLAKGKQIAPGGVAVSVARLKVLYKKLVLTE
jgi:hypothetical protein